jgi:hypothetical protein
MKHYVCNIAPNEMIRGRKWNFGGYSTPMMAGNTDPARLAAAATRRKNAG